MQNDLVSFCRADWLTLLRNSTTYRNRFESGPGKTLRNILLFTVFCGVSDVWAACHMLKSPSLLCFPIPLHVAVSFCRADWLTLLRNSTSNSTTYRNRFESGPGKTLRNMSVARRSWATTQHSPDLVPVL